MPTSKKLYGTRLTALGVATAIVLTAAFTLAAFVAPMDADQGFSQKIFYVHVPLAIVTLGGFVFGGDLRDPVPAHAATRATTCAATPRSTRR